MLLLRALAIGLSAACAGEAGARCEVSSNSLRRLSFARSSKRSHLILTSYHLKRNKKGDTGFVKFGEALAPIRAKHYNVDEKVLL